MVASVGTTWVGRRRSIRGRETVCDTCGPVSNREEENERLDDLSGEPYETRGEQGGRGRVGIGVKERPSQLRRPRSVHTRPRDHGRMDPHLLTNVHRV